MEELKKFSDCKNYKEINPVGNLINVTSNWTITGVLIEPTDVPVEEIVCDSKRKKFLTNFAEINITILGPYCCQSSIEKWRMQWTLVKLLVRWGIF